MIPGATRIFVCPEPVDMRRSFDGLALAAKEHLGEDAKSGALYCFSNKRGNRLKVLWFDRNGFCILYKRLHRARFVLPPSREIDAKTLVWMLRGVENARREALRS
jgi:transposase